MGSAWRNFSPDRGRSPQRHRLPHADRLWPDQNGCRTGDNIDLHISALVGSVGYCRPQGTDNQGAVCRAAARAVGDAAAARARYGRHEPFAGGWSAIDSRRDRLGLRHPSDEKPSLVHRVHRAGDLAIDHRVCAHRHRHPVHRGAAGFHQAQQFGVDRFDLRVRHRRRIWPVDLVSHSGDHAVGGGVDQHAGGAYRRRFFGRMAPE